MAEAEQYYTKLYNALVERETFPSHDHNLSWGGWLDNRGCGLADLQAICREPASESPAKVAEKPIHLDTSRVIVAAWAPDGWMDATVGKEGVTAITPIGEHGQGAEVPWLCVWKGDHLHSKLNAAHLLEIEYAPEDDDGT